jgi:hypothetical protein
MSTTSLSTKDWYESLKRRIMSYFVIHQPNGTVIALLPNDLDAVDPEGDPVTYAINLGPFYSYFVISNDGTGDQLEINKTIDIDDGGPDVMTLEVIAKDPQGLTNKALIIIHILDVNDYSPIFVKPLYTDTIKGTTSA